MTDTSIHSISSLLNDTTTTSNSLPTPVTPTTTSRTASPKVGGKVLPSINKKNHYSTFTVQMDQPQQQSSPNSTTCRMKLTKSFQCDQCYQTFSRLNNLKSHRTTHTSERPFQCNQCHQDFRRHHDLKRHQKLHTGERPFKCTNCDRSFARLDALNRHQRVEGGTACHQKSTTQRPHIPEINIPNPASKPWNNITAAINSNKSFKKDSSNTNNSSNNLLILPWSPSTRTLPLPSPSSSPSASLLSSPPTPPSLSPSPPPPSLMLPSFTQRVTLDNSSSLTSTTSMPRSSPASIRSSLLLSPSSSSSSQSSSASSSPSSRRNSAFEDDSVWKSEYEQMKKTMMSLQEKCQWQEQEIQSLKTACHDLRVENKVLTSLVLTKKQPSASQIS